MIQTDLSQLLPIPSRQFTNLPGNVFAEGRMDSTMIPFGLPDEFRQRHMLLLGKAGTGKTMLMKQLIKQDILRERNIMVIDSDGDLANDLSQTDTIRHSIAIINTYEPQYKHYWSSDKEQLMSLLRENNRLIFSIARSIKQSGEDSQKIVAKILEATYALEKEKLDIQEQKGVFIYINNIAHYKSDDLVMLFSEARRKGINFTLSAQCVGDIDLLIRNSIFANTANFIFFTLSQTDLDYLQHYQIPTNITSQPQHQFLVHTQNPQDGKILIWHGKTITTK